MNPTPESGSSASPAAHVAASATSPATPTATVTLPVRPWWRWPSVISAAVVVAVLAATFAWSLLSTPSGPAPRDGEGLPWQVQTDGSGGSSVFGLAPGRTTLAQVQLRFADELQIRLLAAPGQPAALEGYVERFSAGFVAGKLVLAFEADPRWLREAQARSAKSDVGEDGRTRRYRVSSEDLDRARSFPVVALALIPAARLDEAAITQRFGAPAEVVKGAAGERQLLYPAMGVAVAVPPAEGDAARAKAVIQYVAPRDFEARLRAPLAAAPRQARRGTNRFERARDQVSAQPSENHFVLDNKRESLGPSFVLSVLPG